MPASGVSRALLFSVLAGSSLVAALGQQPVIAFASSTGSFQIAGGSISAGQILVSSNDYWGVSRAAGDLAQDFGRVTGTNYTVSNGESNSAPAKYSYNPVNNFNNTFVCACDPWMRRLANHMPLVHDYRGSFVFWAKLHGALSLEHCDHCWNHWTLRCH